MTSPTDRTAAPVAAITDDGWDALGYAALLDELARRGHSLSAAAPHLAWTSNGTGIGSPAGGAQPVAGPQRGLEEVLEHVSKEVSGVAITVLARPPAAVARHLVTPAGADATARPRALVAGVNHGPNVGADLIHSGTFGCALTAAWHGLPALAVSLDDVYSVDEANPGPLRFDLAARAAGLALDWLLARDAPLLVNLNIPNSVVLGETCFIATMARTDAGHDSTADHRTDRQVLARGQASLTVFAGCDLRGDTTQGLALARHLDRAFANMRS